MRSKLVHEASGQRTFVAVLDIGDEVMSSVLELARREKLRGAQITGIGAFSDAKLKYYEWERKAYRDIAVEEQVEVASLIGDIGADPEGGPALHIHLVLGKRDGSAVAGHLAEAHVRPTLELVVTESPEHLQRQHDQATGLNLLRL